MSHIAKPKIGKPVFPWQIQLSPWQRFRRAPAEFLVQWLDKRRTAPADCASVSPPAGTPPIRIVCISDTHNKQPSVPDADILLHAGDLTNNGTFEELKAQLDWLKSLPHKHKVVVAGNHDRLLDAEYVDRFPDRIYEGPGTSRSDLDWGDLIYLNDTTTDLRLPGCRTLSIYGSPLTEQCGTFAFQYPPIRDVWNNRIPDETDVILGCPQLLKEIWRVRPRLVVFGHIHAGYGQRVIPYDDGAEAAYASVFMRARGVFAACSMVWHIMLQEARGLLQSIFGSSNELPFGMIVNAALMSGDGTRDPLTVQL
ncbi:hypothetical protein KVR01_010638 [Diaporthe batatas]|uniref:uncharacterized protein n=1 Tax=Diaporthe batatas TaxID=748121 RepID=UPI001D0453D0|nr:uncharacterized protein KVR01_010638 [Diaporthe batatas]KAG8160001.1 hypothetical protein KVR01_010638 [Diaporthe batatas]